MVTKYGMSDALGPIKYGSDNSEPFLGRDMGHIRNYSEETASKIDAEVKRMIDNAYQQTEDILRQHMDQLHKVAQYLFRNEKMSGEEFAKMMESSETTEDGTDGDYWKVDENTPAPETP